MSTRERGAAGGGPYEGNLLRVPPPQLRTARRACLAGSAVGTEPDRRSEEPSKSPLGKENTANAQTFDALSLSSPPQALVRVGFRAAIRLPKIASVRARQQLEHMVAAAEGGHHPARLARLACWPGDGAAGWLAT